MKKILFLGLLLSMFVTNAVAQMTLPPRPAPIKQAIILSQTDGILNYVIQNGKRTVFRDLKSTLAADTLVIRAYSFNTPWYPQRVEEEAPEHQSLNEFALMVQRLNRERRTLVRVTGGGNEMVYEYSGNILIGTKNGLINYVIRNGKRESYVLPQPPKVTKVVRIWLYDTSVLQPKATPEKKQTLDEQAFAAYQQQLVKNRWQLKTVAGNCQEIVYYYER